MIASAKPQHPSDQELIDFGSGRLPTDRFERLLEHVEGCDRCQDQIGASVSDDSLGRQLSIGHAGQPDPVLAEPDCHAAIYHAATHHAIGSGAMRLDHVMPPVETLGPYRLIRPLGRGGMGAVYLAEHQRLRKKCAIKLLPRGRSFDSVWIDRFDREMQAVAALSHPGIVTATDAGESHGWHFMTMEYLDGLDLSAIIRRLETVDIASACAIMRDVCWALSSVHDAGLVHRDIKPSNIMLTRRGDVKLLDLGLVLDQNKPIADMRLTTVGHVIGTLAFAAPEQLTESETVDSRSDLYGVGATLFQLITGRTAHDWQRGIAPLVLQKSTQAAKRLKSVRSDVPEALDALVAALLERDPDQRPASASEVAERLQPFSTTTSLTPIITKALRVNDPDPQSNHSLPSINPSLDGGPPRISNRFKWIAAGFGGAAALAILAGTIITIQSDRSTVRIETDDPDIRVQVAQALKPAEETQQNTPEKRFKGEPLSHWLNVLAIERDVDTLGEAINAVASLADVDDVDPAHAILVSARRFGGWSSSSDKTDLSQWYMSLFKGSFGRIMPRPGIPAITRELAEGNDRSRSACLWALQAYDYSAWAKEPTQQETATQLHDALVSLVQSDAVTSERNKSAAKTISLAIANRIPLPLDNEPDLVRSINEGIAKAKTFRTLEDRLADPWPGGVADVMNVLSIDQFVAANRLNITCPPALDSRMLLDLSDQFREERNDWFIDRLKQDPKTYADEAVLFLYTATPTNFSNWGEKFKIVISDNQALWLKVLPQVTAYTTRPDILQMLLKEARQTTNPILIDGKLNSEMTQLIVDTIEKLEPRVQAILEQRLKR